RRLACPVASARRRRGASGADWRTSPTARVQCGDEAPGRLERPEHGARQALVLPPHADERLRPLAPRCDPAELRSRDHPCGARAPVGRLSLLHPLFPAWITASL